MSLLEAGFTRQTRGKKNKVIVDGSSDADDGEDAYEVAEEQIEIRPVSKKRGGKQQEVVRVVKKVKRTGPSDADIDMLLQQLRAHPHRDSHEDNIALEQVLKARLEECERLVQYHRFESRGYSAFEALPNEVLDVIAAHLLWDLGKAKFKQFAFVSKNFSLVVRARLWRKVDKFRSGTVNKLKQGVLGGAGPLIRNIDAPVKSREAQVVCEHAPGLEHLRIQLDKADHLLDRFLKAALRSHHKRLAAIELASHRYMPFTDKYGISSSLAILPALRNIKLVGLLMQREGAESLLGDLTHVKTLQSLNIWSCRATSGRGLSYLVGLGHSSDDEDNSGPLRVPLEHTTTRKFFALKEIHLKNVEWEGTSFTAPFVVCTDNSFTGPFGLRALLHAKDTIESVTLTSIVGHSSTSRNGNMGYTSTSCEGYKLKWSRRFELTIVSSLQLPTLLMAFALEHCEALSIDPQLNNSTFWGEQGLVHIRRYHEGLEYLAEQMSSTIGSCKIFRLARDGRLSILERYIEGGDADAEYHKCAAIFARLEAAAMAHEKEIKIVDEMVIRKRLPHGSSEDDTTSEDDDLLTEYIGLT